MESNFRFLSSEYPILANLGILAERYIHDDTNTSLFKMRLFGEKMVETIFEIHQLDFPYDNTAFRRLEMLRRTGGSTPHRWQCPGFAGADKTGKRRIGERWEVEEDEGGGRIECCCGTEGEVWKEIKINTPCTNFIHMNLRDGSIFRILQKITPLVLLSVLIFFPDAIAILME
jgi:hypothetical protein